MSWLWTLFGKGNPKTRRLEIPKYADNPGPMSVQLSTALQYGAFASFLEVYRRTRADFAAQEPPLVFPLSKPLLALS